MKRAGLPGDAIVVTSRDSMVEARQVVLEWLVR